MGTGTDIYQHARPRTYKEQLIATRKVWESKLWKMVKAWAQSTCPELSAQGLVPLRWGCALPSPNAPGKAPDHIHTTLRWGRAPGKPSLAGACWAHPKGSQASFGVWREDSGLLFRSCRKEGWGPWGTLSRARAPRSLGGTVPCVPSTCASDLRKLLSAPLRSQGHCGVGRGLSDLHWVWCNGRGPNLAAAYQAPPSMGFSRQEYWSGVPLPSPSSVVL